MKRALEARLLECGIHPGYSVYLMEGMKAGRVLKTCPEGMFLLEKTFLQDMFLLEGTILQKQKHDACGCPMDCPNGGVGFCKI